MEDAQSHPIPQDVTGFQFKIIGDMTVKQFVYMAASAVLAWVFYQLPIISIVKLPITIFLGGIGPALAFVPLEGRPMDLMIVNFIKALFNPTRYIYRKSGGTAWQSVAGLQKALPKTDLPISLNAQPYDSKVAKTQGNLGLLGQKITIQKPIPNEPLINTPVNVMPQINIQNITSATIPLQKTQAISSTPGEQASPTRIISMFTPHAQKQSDYKKPESPQFEKSQDDKDKNEALKKKVEALEKDIEITRKEKAELEQKQSVLTFPQQQESLSLEKQLQAVLAQKEELTKQLMILQQKIDLQKSNIFEPTMATIKTQTQNVKQIPKGMGKNIGIPNAPEAPNIITGIIKDPRGNPLGNILVEVKDKEGNPVRAFKTNGLGKFVSATPLANGEYTISFEDPKGQNKFDAIGFEAVGDIILPIEVTSVDEREELRKSLFREG